MLLIKCCFWKLIEFSAIYLALAGLWYMIVSMAQTIVVTLRLMYSFECNRCDHSYSNFMTLKKREKTEWIESPAETFAVLAL